MAYLDNDGVLYLWQKIKNLLSNKVDKVDGKTLTSNDFTNEEKTKLAGITAGANAYSLPEATGSVLGGVKVGSNVSVAGGVISLSKKNVTDALGYTPPMTNTTYTGATSSASGLMSATDKAKLDAFGTADKYALKSDITNMYKFKGSVATVGDLPTTATAGDVYNVESDGMNYAFDGGSWDSLGATQVTIVAISNGEIDSICK